ncbi:antirestriction protein ArdC [Nocardiopsis mwathae]|uniref:Antirestriction protein ArdC n=1 Tax=Nocardiopsis mwathae TaxID=1472723 RepID=A0A7W9YML2_9ACTN|nr:ArdC-like ssDNA-binding domain-containing protein [Nocardiopsis mwathae]MBB6174955.1 antirestriction protein ArdC [Nocardiopsis mwathae]
MRSRKPKLTPEQRRERIKAAHDKLSGAVDGLLTSEGWQAMVTSRAWLRRYSLNNMMLITSQFPDATDVRPYSQWKEAGRHVRKGEKGIRIFAPCRYKARDEDGNEETDASGNPRYQVRGFTVVSVFDVSQTDGDPLLSADGSAPQELTGMAPEQLWDGIAAHINKRGFTVERGDCGSAYGFTRWATRTVRVRSAVEDAQAVKTLVHELAHIACEHEERQTTTPRALLEVEAESVACIVTHVAGLDSLAYSVPYVAGWAGDSETAHASAERVVQVADQIISALGEAAPSPAARAVSAA